MPGEHTSFKPEVAGKLGIGQPGPVLVALSSSPRAPRSSHTSTTIDHAMRVALEPGVWPRRRMTAPAERRWHLRAALLLVGRAREVSR